MNAPFLTSLSVSCLCHVLVLVAFLWMPQPTVLPSAPIPQAMQAHVVSKAQLQEITRYKEAQKKAEQERLNALKREAERKAQAKRQEVLKREAAKKAAEAKRQAALKAAQAQKEAEMQRQKALKLAQKKKAEEAQRQAALKIAQEKKAAERKRQQDAAQMQRQEKLKKQQLLAKEQEAQLQSQLAEELALIEAEHALYVDEQVAYYQSLIQNTIKRHWFVEPDMKNQSCRILLRLSSGGFIVDMQKIEGSDRICNAAQLALRKIDELPIPQDPEIFSKFREFTLTLTL